MDQTAFFKLTYGLYIVSGNANGKDCGCIVNTLAQVTAAPAKLSVTINKENATAKAIMQSRYFAAVALTETADMQLIGTFGFKTSADTDKFSNFSCNRDQNGVLYVTEHTAAQYSCKVCDVLDLGTHLLFVGEVCEAENTSNAPVMTYAYYHSVKKGQTPKNAPSYQAQQPEQKKGYRCSICGYVLESDTLPHDFICPICGQKADKFYKIEA